MSTRLSKNSPPQLAAVENPLIDNQKDHANRQNLPPSSIDNQSPRGAPFIIHHSSFVISKRLPFWRQKLACRPRERPMVADIASPECPASLDSSRSPKKMPRAARWHVNCCTDNQRQRLSFLVTNPRGPPLDL
jgi:hypothetical protein